VSAQLKVASLEATAMNGKSRADGGVRAGDLLP
jgi:hypothetical protein